MFQKFEFPVHVTAILFAALLLLAILFLGGQPSPAHWDIDHSTSTNVSPTYHTAWDN